MIIFACLLISILELLEKRKMRYKERGERRERKREREREREK